MSHDYQYLHSVVKLSDVLKGHADLGKTNDDDVRVIRNLERRALDLRDMLWKIEERRDKRIEKFEKRIAADYETRLHVDYDFSDLMA